MPPTAPRLPKPSPFSKRLTDARKLRRMSTRDLSAPADCSAALVSLLEAGKTEPTLSTVEALARVLAVSPEWLAFGVGEGPVERAEDQAREAPRAGRPRGTGKAQPSAALTASTDGS